MFNPICPQTKVACTLFPINRLVSWKQTSIWSRSRIPPYPWAEVFFYISQSELFIPEWFSNTQSPWKFATCFGGKLCDRKLKTGTLCRWILMHYNWVSLQLDVFAFEKILTNHVSHSLRYTISDQIIFSTSRPEGASQHILGWCTRWIVVEAITVLHVITLLKALVEVSRLHPIQPLIQVESTFLAINLGVSICWKEHQLLVEHTTSMFGEQADQSVHLQEEDSKFPSELSWAKLPFSHIFALR